MLYVGGGAGMAPMRSHLYQLFRTIKSGRKVNFWYGGRSKRELFYVDHFRALEKDFPNFKFYDSSNDEIIEAESNVEIQQPKFVGEYDKFNFVESLKDAWAVVNHNSNPAIEAVIHGIPVFVGESSLCYDVGNHHLSNIEDPLMPDRTKWCNEIAHTEWTVEEIEEGLPLQRLVPKLEEMINVRQKKSFNCNSSKSR